MFSDRPTTVRRGTDRRPGESALLDAIRRGEVQSVLMLGLDRMGRSLTDLAAFLETCRVAGVTLWVDEQGIDTAGSNGLSLFDMPRMMAVRLRQSRRDRILRGQAASRALSIRAGRPPIAPTKIEKAKLLLNAGKGVRQAARLSGISAASVSRPKDSMGAAFAVN